MGAANCCKKPEEVLEEGKYTTVGGNYDNPHVTPIENEGFPHDSNSQIMKSQNVKVESSQQQVEQDATKLASQQDAKLYEQYFDASKVGATYEVPGASTNLSGFDVQNVQNTGAGNVVASAYEIPTTSANFQAVGSPVADGAGAFDVNANAAYNISGTPNVASAAAYNISNSPNVSSGAAYNLAGTPNVATAYNVSATPNVSSDAFGITGTPHVPASSQVQNYELQQAASPNAQIDVKSATTGNVQNYEIPNAAQASANAATTEAATATATKIASYEFPVGAAVTSPVATNDLGAMASDQQAFTKVVSSSTPVVASTNVDVNNVLSSQAQEIAATQGVEITGTAQSNLAGFSFGNVDTTNDLAALGAQGATSTNVEATYNAPIATTNLEGFTASSPVVGATVDMAGYDLGANAVVDTTGLQTVASPDLNAVSYGGQVETANYAGYDFSGSQAVASDFNAFGISGIQTSGVTTGPTAVTAVFNSPAITTTNYTTSYQIPATTTTTTTKTVYQSAFAAPTSTTTIGTTVGLPATTYASVSPSYM